MLLNMGGIFTSSHTLFSPPLFHVGGILPSPRMASSTALTRNISGRSVNIINGLSTRRRRTRPNSARLLHPVGSFPEGVPSSLFALQPPVRKDGPIESTTPTAIGGSTSGKVAAGTTVVGAAVATPATSVDTPVDVTKALDVRLVEESDLPDISALLAEVFEPSIVIDGTELRSEESIERLEKANKYLKRMAYKKILRSIRSRCGKRLRRGDFALNSDALVMAVRDSHCSPSAGAPPASGQLVNELNAGGDDGDTGEIVAVVELCLRQPEGWLPFNGFFYSPMGWEPYMCNLAVAEKYRRNGYAKQLVLLCENVARFHWGYERMYLHVDADSPAATQLYSTMGYEMMEQLQPPRWVKKLLGLRNIRYQVKHFNGKKGPTFGR